jgi:anti-sigma factor RsiW
MTTLTCREFTEFLMAYLDGELAPDAAAAFEAHLAVCEDCVNYLDSYRATVELDRQAFAELDAALPADVPEELVQAILDARARA